MNDKHRTRIEALLEALKEARIYAGAEFEACCNENEYSRAIYFSGFRDVLATYISSLEDYKSVFQSTDCCPVCGKKTSEGKNGGKICFECVNERRGL
jgi:hypothetical protein